MTQINTHKHKIRNGYPRTLYQRPKIISKKFRAPFINLKVLSKVPQVIIKFELCAHIQIKANMHLYNERINNQSTLKLRSKIMNIVRVLRFATMDRKMQNSHIIFLRTISPLRTSLNASLNNILFPFVLFAIELH